MYEKRFLDIKVQCPGSPYPKVEKMQITLILFPDGIWTPAPCNGCDSINGTMPCMECCAAVTRVFIKDPEADVTKVFHLDLSSTQK